MIPSNPTAATRASNRNMLDRALSPEMGWTMERGVALLAVVLTSRPLRLRRKSLNSRSGVSTIPGPTLGLLTPTLRHMSPNDRGTPSQ